MKAAEKIKNLPVRLKKQMQTALLLLCAVATFAVPAFGDGYSILKDEPVVSSAAGAIQDVDLLLVAASAYGQAKKTAYASNDDVVKTFIKNTSTIVGGKWQNIGLIIGARDNLAGSAWSMYQSPTTLSGTEIAAYANYEGTGSDKIAASYNKYKAFGYAMQNLRAKALKSKNTAVSVNEGLDAMSTAAVKLGSFGVKFLNDYNPGPVLLTLYDSSYLQKYYQNKLVQIVARNSALKTIICFFGDPVADTGISFFLIVNAVMAVVGFALSLILTLLGNRNIGDGVRQFIIRIAIGTAGIYVVANVMSTTLKWVSDTVMNVGLSDTTAYVENNLNFYDWYLTGFALPSGLILEIDSTGNFVFSPDDIRKINEYTYGRLMGNPSDAVMKLRMWSYSQNGNRAMASFVTPSMTFAVGEDADKVTSGWDTDAYYAIMNNYAQNKEDLLDGKDEEGSPLQGKWNAAYASQYFWMSSLSMVQNGDGWKVVGMGNSNYYGLNPISAFNLIRSDFSGEAITARAEPYPEIPYVAFDAVTIFDNSGSNNMNAITRFIACFTLVMAAMKGLITIFTAGFGAMLSGGVKTAFGSSHGFGQALGGVVALILGVVGISFIMSTTLSLLDTVYGIGKSLLGDVEVLDAFLAPLQEALGKVPVAGDALKWLARSVTEMILTLILALTFPKLGGIPITVFAQYVADLPGRIAEKAQMIEGMLMSGRSSAGGGLSGGGRGQSGRYGQMGRQMAGQAFSSGARQAGQVLKAGTMAAASLAGAGLSAAGKALNKQGDKLEGKPNNPGINGWDDMSPEQQAKAADVAANTENWKDMDQDSKRKALDEAGVFDDNKAESATSGTGEATEHPTGSAETEEAVSGAEKEAAPGAKKEEAPEDEAKKEETPKDEAEKQVAEAGGSGENGNMSEQSLGQPSETGSAEGLQTGEPDNAPEQSLNVNEGDNDGNDNQQISEAVEVNTNMEATQVDQGQSVNEETISNPDEETEDVTDASDEEAADVTDKVPDSADSMNGTGTPAAEGPGMTEGMQYGDDGLPVATGTGDGASVGQGTGGTTNIKSANTTSSDNSSRTTVQNNNTKNGGEKQSVSSPGGPPPGSSSQNAQGTQNASGGTAGQSVSSTSKSAWGKEMTVKQQKQARALHAIGDGLQMMGGNRTMKEGIRDAIGYTAEAAAASVVPPEIMSTFAQDLRNKRQLRQELRRNDNQKKK